MHFTQCPFCKLEVIYPPSDNSKDIINIYTCPGTTCRSYNVGFTYAVDGLNAGSLYFSVDTPHDELYYISYKLHTNHLIIYKDKKYLDYFSNQPIVKITFNTFKVIISPSNFYTKLPTLINFL